MAKITIVVEDKPGSDTEVSLHIDFDPPMKNKEDDEITNAQATALHMVEAAAVFAQSSHDEDEED